MDAADRTFLFKTAVKDVLAQRGILGTFIGKPWDDEGGSGFHLHFSMNDKDGVNLMGTPEGELSELARNIMGGVLKHANAIAAFTNPTVNSYKRLGPDTMAPYRNTWGYDNRSAMIRIPPERGAGTRLELRIGDGSANPYVVIAVVLAAALDGIKNKLSAPEPVVGWSYTDAEHGQVLPTTLPEALDALDADEELRNHLSTRFIRAFAALKRDEARRYEEEVDDPSTRLVTQWELEEYIEDF
jgi:glutamine synthetase